MTTHTLRPDNVLSLVRGRGERPAVDTSLGAFVRTLCDEKLTPLVTAHTYATPRTVSARTLRGDVFSGTSPAFARLRGVMIGTLTRLRAHGVAIDRPFHDALAVLQAERPGGLREDLAALDANEMAQLAADVDAHDVVLGRSLPSVPSLWRPRTAVRARVRVANDLVELRDVADLVVGSKNGDNAALGLIDVTTAPLGPHEEKILRFHALTHTLRDGIAPLRCAVLSTATGDTWVLDVDADVLIRAVDDLVSVCEVAA